MSDAELDKLREDAESVGVTVDRRWGADRLRQEIDRALAEAPPTAPDIGERGTVEALSGEGSPARLMFAPGCTCPVDRATSELLGRRLDCPMHGDEGTEG